MAQQIGAELNIKTKKSTLDNLSEVELQLSKVNKDLRDAKKLGKDDVYKSLRKQQADLKDESKKLNRELKDGNVQLSDLVDNFRIGFVRVGDFKAGLANAQKTMGLFSNATKVQIGLSKALKVVLISSGIGALVVALGTLITFLTKTQKGMDLVARVGAVVNSVIDNLVESAAQFGEGLADIFSGNFSEGFNKLKGSVQGLGAEIVNDAKAADRLQKATQDLAQEEIGLNIILAERRRKLKELEKIADNQDLKRADRAKAAREGLAVAKQIGDIEERTANKRIDILREQQELGITNREDEAELAALIAQREERSAANIKQETKLQNKLNTALGITAETVKKTSKDIEEIAENSLAGMNAKLAELNKHLQGQDLEGSALKDKLTEIIDLEGEIENFNNKLEEMRNRIQGGDRTTSSLSALAGPDLGGVGVGGEDTLVQEQREKELERTEKYYADLQEIRNNANEEQVAMTQSTYNTLAELTGAFAAGEIETFADFAKQALSALVDLLVGQLRARLAAATAEALLNPNPIARARALAGIAAGQIAISALSGLAKGTISKLEKGGTVNDGFVANGPRHAHGGINIGNGQEIEGGEPVLTRRAAQLFPAQINAINQASGGRKILQGGGILGTAGPVLPNSFGSSTAMVDKDSIEKIESAVRRGAAAGLDIYARRSERENELENRNVA